MPLPEGAAPPGAWGAAAAAVAAGAAAAEVFWGAAGVVALAAALGLAVPAVEALALAAGLVAALVCSVGGVARGRGARASWAVGLGTMRLGVLVVCLVLAGQLLQSSGLVAAGGWGGLVLAREEASDKGGGAGGLGPRRGLLPARSHQAPGLGGRVGACGHAQGQGGHEEQAAQTDRRRARGGHCVCLQSGGTQTEGTVGRSV